MDKLSIGIIGTNFISDTFCQAAISEGILPAAVYSRTLEKGTEFAEKYGIKHVFCNFDEFCGSDVINSAYVASPNVCHFPQSKALLCAGKNVLAEKPACPSAKEFSLLCDMAEKNGLVFMEAMRPVHDPAASEIKKELAVCGKLRYASFEYSQYSSRYDRFKNGIMTNAFTPSLCNAAIMDIGIYPIELCAYLFGKPDSIISRSVMLENGFEGMGNIILGYGDMTCHIAYSKITEAYFPSFIRGEDAEISFGHALSKIDTIKICERNGNERISGFSPAANNMIYELRDFISFTEKGFVPPEYTEATLTALEIVDEVRKQNNIEFK